MLFFLSLSIFVILMALAENYGIKLPRSHSILFLVLWLCAGLSYGFSIDYQTYADAYTYPEDGYEGLFTPVWRWYAAALRWVGFSSRAWFLGVSLLTMSLFFKGFRKMSDNPTLSIVLFVVGFFYFESLNAIRQYVSIAILFASFPWVMEGKTWKYLLAVVVAAQFHASAWVMLPLIFVVKIKWPTWSLASVLALTFVLGTRLMNLVFGVAMSVMGGEGYATYLASDLWESTPSGLLKVFYNACAAVLLITSSRIRRIDPRYYLYINAVVVAIVLYNTFYTFLPAMRLYWYLFPFITVLFPIVLRAFTPSSRIIITATVVCAFMAISLRMILGTMAGGFLLDYGFDLHLF